MEFQIKMKIQYPNVQTCNVRAIIDVRLDNDICISHIIKYKHNNWSLRLDKVSNLIIWSFKIID